MTKAKNTEVPTDRKTYLGGSDAAAVIGVSPWTTPVALYLKKRGELPQPTEEDRVRDRMLERGKREEPRIVDDLINLWGFKVTKRSTPENQNRYVDPEFPFMAAEIDFEFEVTPEIVQTLAFNAGIIVPPELIGTIQNGEVKTAHPFVAQKKFGEEGTDEIPVEYGAQAQWGQMVTGKQMTVLALGVYCNDPILYVVFRDDEYVIKPMRAAAVKFWNEHVLAGVPPAAKNVPDVAMLFGRVTSTSKEATPEIAALVTGMQAMNARKTACEEAAEVLKFEIGSFMLGAEQIAKPTKLGLHALTYQGQPILNVTLESQVRVDNDKLRLKFPEAAEECAKPISFFVYRKPRKKG